MGWIGTARDDVSPLVRTAGRALGAGRIAVGVALVAVPALATRQWLGETDEDDTGRAIAVRGLGARDIVLGVGTLVALRPGADRREAARWIEAGVVADLADAAATIVAGANDAGRATSLGVALGAAVGGAAIRAGLR